MANSFGGQGIGTNYRGTNAQQPPNMTFNTRNPNQYDTKNVSLGDLWMNTSTEELWVLMSLQGTSSSIGMLADWVLLTGGAGTVVSLTSNSGGAVGPDIGGNINTVGDGTTITGVGNPGTNTITLSTTGSVATSFVTDSGTATPAAGVIDVLGGTAARDIHTSASGHTIHVDLNNSITLGDLSPIAANSNALSAVTGDINISDGCLKLPDFNGTDSSSGAIKVNGVRYFTTWPRIVGSSSVFLGENAGNDSNSALTNTGNTGMGTAVLSKTTSSTGNSGFGINALKNLATSGILTPGNNCSFGSNSLKNLVSGVSNICIGADAGTQYTGAESYNIILGASSLAGVTGENNIMRLGVVDALPSQTAQTYMAGVAGVTVSNAQMVTIDTVTGQMGSQTTPGSVAFQATITAPSGVQTGDNTIYQVVFGGTNFGGSNFNTTTGVFTAPVTGKYMLSSFILLQGLDVAHIDYVYKLVTTARSYYSGFGNIGAMQNASNNFTVSFPATVVDMTAGDTAFMTIQVAGGAKIVGVAGGGGTTNGFFSGHLV